MRLRELAAELGRELEGDGEGWIEGVASLEGAGPRDLAHARSERFATAARASAAAALIAPPGLDTGGRPAIRSPNPGLDFARAARRLAPAAAHEPGVHPTAWVDPSARVDASASVGPGCVVGARSRVGAGSRLHARVTLYPDVEVGAACEIHAGCVLREGTRLGDRVVLQPGAVLGSDGFGYALDEEGRLEAHPRLGRVVVEDDVEIGANTAVDRGTLGDTRIGRGAKLDNLVQIAHNVRIGKLCLIMAQVGIAGSVRVEDGAMLLGQVGVSGHHTVGAGARLAAQAGVFGDIPAGETWSGYPARPHKEALRAQAALFKLPSLMRRIERLLDSTPDTK